MAYSIRMLPLEDRPRERLMQSGPEALSNIELLAIILGSGTRNRTVMELAHDLLTTFGSLSNLSQATLSELSHINGIGKVKAVQLKAALDLGLRASKQNASPRYRIQHPSHAYHLVRDELERETRELFVAIFLDVKSYLIAHETISIGTLSETLVHPRELFYPAIRHKAASVLVAHNHPSGDATPSAADLTLTQTLIQAGKLMGIPLVDHLIIGKSIYTSLKETSDLFAA